MTHQDKISILITLVVGLVAGAYLYVAGFATTFKLPDVTTDKAYAELVITGQNFGVCEVDNSCLSFQLLQDGSYRALFDNQAGGKKIEREGKVPSSQRRELSRVLTNTAISASAKEMDTPACHYDSTKDNYRFKITLDDIDYVIDTCKTSVDYKGNVWMSLAKLWNYLANVKS